jgi:hypothetical protein
MGDVYLSEFHRERASSRLSPPENLVSTGTRAARHGNSLGIIEPRQNREAIPHPAGTAELVVGDQGMSSDAPWFVRLPNPFSFLFS